MASNFERRFYLRILLIAVAITVLILDHSRAQAVNKIDKQRRRQGFWRIYFPSFGELPNNIREGFYYNDRLIGVWMEKTAKGVPLKAMIFYDTLEYKVQEIQYYRNGNIKSAGFEVSMPTNGKDTFRSFDPAVNKEISIVISSRFVKEGNWSFFYENGVLESQGCYKADIKSGDWKYYDVRGELVKNQADSLQLRQRPETNTSASDSGHSQNP